VYSGIGLNVKYQKKNWIGWSETSCEELIWGWEGIEYEYKLNYSLPYNSTPKRKEYTYVPAVKDKKALTINFLDNEINVPYEKGINASLKYLYNRAEQLLAPEAINIRNQKLAQFREMFPDKVKVVVAPYVEKKYNTKSFSKNFDWSTCEVSLTFGNGNSIKDIVGMKNSASNFDVKKIRVFGIAKRGNEYKGIGIKKDK